MEFEEIGKDEKKLLLKAFNYEVDEKGVIKDMLLKEPLISKDTKRAITLENASLAQGSLNIIDTTSLTLSKFIREKFELNKEDA